jgi:cobalt-zinc-cadmium efflux system protein
VETEGVNTVPHVHEADSALKRRLKVAVVLTSVIFAAELIGGYLFNSLALLSDAAHVFMDVFALSLTWFAIYISALPPTEKRTFGLHRAEVFASFINSFFLLAIIIFIFYKASVRLFNPQPVESVGMLVVAVVGLVVNIIVAFWLMRYAKNDLNIKSAYLHVVGDAVASVGVIIASIVIYYTGWMAIDPLISFAIGAIIFIGAYKILKESSHILLEGTPTEIDLKQVVTEITETEGVESVHSLHIWSICHNVYALSAHVDLKPLERVRMGEIFNAVNEKLAERHHIFYTTLQAECVGCDRGDIFGTVAHKNDGHGHSH